MESNFLLVANAGFILLTLVYLYLLLNQLWKGIQKTEWEDVRKKRILTFTIGSLVAWLLFVAVWALSGRMSDFSNFPFNFMPIIAVPLAAIILLIIYSKSLVEVLQQIPPENIIRLQTFRVFVEVLLWALFVAGVAPEQMTFEGRNFDVVSGLTAPVIAFLVVRKKISKTGIIIWNIVCLGILINIVAIAVLSTPSPWRIFMEEPSNTIVTYFPVCWLPGFLVPLAYTLHFFSLKQMFSRASKKQLQTV